MLIIYTKNNCPYCEQAKNLLMLKGISFKTINVEDNEAAQYLLKTAGYKSVPQIYKNGKLFVKGGYQGLRKLTDEQLKGDGNVGE